MYAAEPPQEPLPYGRWAEALAEHFAKAAEAEIGEITWFPERSFGGRTYVPATAPSDEGEVFGYVSYTREHEGAQASDLEAVADYTDETAADNPDWTLDLSDQEIGHWRGPQGRRGVITLVWGVALVAERRGGHGRARAHHHRPVRAARGPLHARVARRVHRRLRGGARSTGPTAPSWRASRCTRTATDPASVAGCPGGRRVRGWAWWGVGAAVNCVHL